MLKRLSAGLADANKWGQDATPDDVGQAFRDLAFTLTKLFLALIYFMIGVTFLLVGSVESLVTRKRGEIGDKREKKLKGHLDWDRPKEPQQPTGALRR